MFPIVLVLALIVGAASALAQPPPPTAAVAAGRSRAANDPTRHSVWNRSDSDRSRRVTAADGRPLRLARVAMVEDLAKP